MGAEILGTRADAPSKPLVLTDKEPYREELFRAVKERGWFDLLTFYNAPNVELLRAHYENLPAKLQRQSVDPRIPWLYNFKLDFRFK
jgi:hypothetical protein